MAYNPVPTVATGDLWTASNHNTYIRDNFAAGVPDILAAKGDLVVGTGPNAATRLAIGSNGQRLVADSAQPTGVKWSDDYYVIGVVMDGGGGDVEPRVVADIEVPLAGTIQRVTMLADAAGWLLAQISKSTYSSYPSLSSICSYNLPGVFGSGSNLTGTVSKTSGGTTLTGSGTSFTSQLSVGQVIDVPGGSGVERRVVAGISSNTQLTVNEAWGSSASGQTCTRYASANKRQDTSLSNWTTSLAAGDILRIECKAAKTIGRATLSLLIKKG